MHFPTFLGKLQYTWLLLSDDGGFYNDINEVTRPGYGNVGDPANVIPEYKIDRCLVVVGNVRPA